MTGAPAARGGAPVCRDPPVAADLFVLVDRHRPADGGAGPPAAAAAAALMGVKLPDDGGHGKLAQAAHGRLLGLFGRLHQQAPEAYPFAAAAAGGDDGAGGGQSELAKDLARSGGEALLHHGHVVGEIVLGHVLLVLLVGGAVGPLRRVLRAGLVAARRPQPLLLLLLLLLPVVVGRRGRSFVSALGQQLVLTGIGRPWSAGRSVFRRKGGKEEKKWRSEAGGCISSHWNGGRVRGWF